MKKHAVIGLIGILALLLIVAAACGGGDNQGANGQENGGNGAQTESLGASNQTQSDSGATDKEAGDEQKDEATDLQEARVIEHAMGTDEISGTPLKVVTLAQGVTDAAVLLGVQPIGAVESWIEQPWYLYLRDKMDGVVNLGSENQPNLEEIMALKPDVIIGSKSRHEKIYEQLKAIAPTFMTEEVFDWRDSLAITAAALNKQAEEQAFLQQWDDRVAEFKQTMGDRLNDTEVAVIDFRADHVRIVYSGFAAAVLDELGVPRPDNQKGESWGVKLTTKENIPQMNADVIFDQTSLDRDDGRVDVRASWMEHPLWNNLRAVQSGKVYEVDTAVWNNGAGPIAASLLVDDLFEFLDVIQ